jgi:CheY-like chemotaxis protein
MTPKRLKPARVLLVEDYGDTRAMYATYLRHCGFEILEAQDGLEALKVADAERPDAIVMDLALPRLDGWEATRRLKANRRTKGIPVIALTGHGLPHHEGGAREAGCAAFLLKPCLPDALAAEVRRVMAGTRRRAPRTGRRTPPRD